jgi:hypothetical protein
VLVPRCSGTPVAMWAWPTWVMSRRRALEAVFVLLESSSPSRRVFIGSHSLPLSSLPYRSFKWTNTGSCGLPTPTRRTGRQVRTEQLEPELLKVNSSFPLHDLRNQHRDCYQIIGEDEAQLGYAIRTNL